jgi:hypothetical protein
MSGGKPQTAKSYATLQAQNELPILHATTFAFSSLLPDRNFIRPLKQNLQ